MFKPKLTLHGWGFVNGQLSCLDMWNLLQELRSNSRISFFKWVWNAEAQRINWTHYFLCFYFLNQNIIIHHKHEQLFVHRYFSSAMKKRLMESLTSCCHSSLQVACDTSPYWMCWVERIRGASGCWCLTWQSNTERGDFPAPESFTGRSYTQESQQCAPSAAGGDAVKVYQRLHLKSQRRKNAAYDAAIHTERSSKRTSLTLYLCADPLTPRKHHQINLNE